MPQESSKQIKIEWTDAENVSVRLGLNISCICGID